MCEEEETRTPTSQLTLPPQSSASTNSATSPNIKSFILTGAQNRTRTCTPRDIRTWNVRVYQFRHLGIGNNLFHLAFIRMWAENGTRTRDPNLGKVVLYQLSYFRNFPLYQRSTSLNAVAKVLLFSKPANFLEVFFQENAIFLVFGVFLGCF